MARRSPAFPADWLLRSSLVGSLLLLALAASVLAGWVERIDALVQLHAGYVPMQPNTALGLSAGVLALFAMEAGRRRIAVCLALVPIAIGSLTLAEHVLGWNLHIDQALVQVYITVDPSHPGRMSRLTALAILTVGLCLFWLNFRAGLRYRSLGTALTASLVGSIGLAPMLGWVAGLSVASPWSRIDQPAPLTAIGLTLMGALLLLRVWRNDPGSRMHLPAWLPAPVVAAGVTLTLLFAASLHDRELGYVRSAARLTINNAATVLNLEFDSQAKALQRMAARWREIDERSATLRDQDGRAYQEDFPALRSLTLVGRSGHTAWFFPKQGNEYLTAYDHLDNRLHAELIKEARTSGQPVFSPVIHLPLGGTGFLICVPLPGSAGSPAEELIGEFSYPELISTLERRLNLSALYAVAIDAAGRQVFRQYPSSPVRHSLRQSESFNLFNQHLRIELVPSERAIQRNQHLIPKALTVLGLGLSLLLGLVVDLTRRTLVRHRVAEEANARLIAENDERRRAEQALRASQAAARKLSLVASSTDNLVAITDAGGRLEWINESFTRHLAISLSEAIGRPLTQLLVSPDADPVGVSRLRQAIAQGKTFDGEVVCHALNGRRYDLHLELQPVVADGEKAENFIAVLTDITARVATETHLRRAKEEADAASRAKSEFLASMSHEIRTPMNGVIGMTSLLLETPLDPEQRDCVNTIRSSGDALLAIINDILDFSQIESGRMALDHQPFELAGCLEEALDLFAVQAAAKHIDLAYFVDPEVPRWIVGDPARLRQVIVNLVNNAVKFTPRGQVSLEVTIPDATRSPIVADSGEKIPPGTFLLEIAVRDTGIGIPPGKQDLLFKPFTQVDSSTTRKYGGTGLGLAICQRFVGLMGGDIHVRSVPDEGSVFTFTIKTQAGSPSESAPATGVQGDLAGKTALIVDSHAASRRFLVLYLTDCGFSCETVDDGAAAREFLERHEPPALLIVSQMLPDGDGRILLQELRGRSGRPRPPALLLLLEGEPAPRDQPDGQGRTVCLYKPVKSAGLASALRSLFVPAGPADGAAAGAAGDAEAPHHRLLSEEIPLEILLVEDNPVNQTVALGLLSRLGYKAVAADGAAAALQLIEQRDFSLVLMDVQMPEMNGLECTKEIRRRLPGVRQPCIIAVTANALSGDREICLATGMNDYLTKPLKLHLLAAAIRRNFSTDAAT